MRLTLTLAAASIAALAADSHCQSLLRDLRSGASDPSLASDLRGFVTFAGATWFTAMDGSGRELWRSDGTPQGTAMFVDLNPGPAHSCRPTTPLIEVGGVLVFPATDPSGTGLWRTDGTIAGTRPIGPRDLWMIEGDHAQLVHNGVLFFAAVDGVHGIELWRTDGTDAGTRLVADVNPGNASAFPPLPFQPFLAAFGADVVFGADDGVRGIEPWLSDGTAAGTRLLADVWPGVGASDPRLFFDLGGRLLFAASVVENPRLPTWWTSDGTAAGTAPLSALQIDAYGTRPAVRIGNTVLFSGFASQHGRELWRTDGTSQGTWLVQDLLPGNWWSNPREFVEIGGVAYFAARAPSTSTRLWRTDGTAQGTSEVVPASGSAPAEVSNLAPVGARLFFGGRNSTDGYEPWLSDGTAAGTSQLLDLNPGVFGSTPREFAALGSRVVFSADDGTHGAEPWVSDGTAANTVLFADLRGTVSSSHPDEWVRAGERAFFVTQDQRELWATDGTGAGTRLVIASPAFGTVEPDGDALLVAFGNSLLRVDPTDWASRAFLSLPGPVVGAERVGDRLFVSASPSLYRYDGGAGAPALVRSFQGSFYAVPPIRMTAVDSTLFFLASEGLLVASGLWRSDGTTAGTVLVHAGAVGPLAGGDSIVDMLSAHGRLWFVDTSARIAELWVADQNSATKVADIGAAPLVHPPQLVAFGPGVAFAGGDATAGIEPWFSDGTPAGTAPIADLRPGPEGSLPESMVVAGATLFFAADDGTSGSELWKSDRSAAGTVRVADLVPGPAGSHPDALAAAGSGDRIVFSAYDPGHGSEPWTSDGTAAGTRRIADLAAGPASSVPGGFTRAGAALVFAADDGLAGREPWAVPLADTGAWLAARFGAGCAGTAGEPQLDGSGEARVGVAGFGAGLSNARPSASAGLLGAARPAITTFPGGCTLLLDSPFAVATGVTDGAGHVAFPLSIPNVASLVGAELRLQAVVTDPAGALAGVLALSDGLHVVIGR